MIYTLIQSWLSTKIRRMTYKDMHTNLVTLDWAVHNSLNLCFVCVWPSTKKSQVSSHKISCWLPCLFFLQAGTITWPELDNTRSQLGRTQGQLPTGTQGIEIFCTFYQKPCQIRGYDNDFHHQLNTILAGLM